MNPSIPFFDSSGCQERSKNIPSTKMGSTLSDASIPPSNFASLRAMTGFEEGSEKHSRKRTGAIDRYLEEVRRIYHSQLYIDLTVNYDAAGAGLAGGQSLREFLDSLTGNEMLKCILSMHCLLHGVTPEEVSFACHACVAGSYYESASGIKGGGLSLSEAFDARLRESGVDVYCGMEVSGILLSEDDRTVRGLRLADGNSVDCEICISTIHPARFLGLVSPAAFRPIYRKRLETLEDTCSAVIVYGECEQVPDSLRKNNILLFPGPRFPDTEEDGPVGEKPFFIAPAPQNSDGSTAEGCIIICPVPNMGSEHRPAGLTGDDRDSYRRYKESMSRDILAHIESSCPEFRGKIKEVECATPLTLKRYTHSPLGSIYGVKHRVDQQNPLPMTRIKNLFLAGQAITAPGILGAVVSGFLACGSLLGHDKLREELQEWA